MLLFVGLGNPEKKYQENRHNIGFQLIDAISDHYGFPAQRKKFQGYISEGMIDGSGISSKVLLLKPYTYYNESGNSVRETISFYKIPADKVFVFYDELDLAPGKVKIKKGGGAAGNNGIKSVSAHIGPDFHRIRVGIGHPGDKSRVTGHVLSDFSNAEKAEWLDDLKTSIVQNISLLAASENGSDRFLSTISLAHKKSLQEKPASTSDKNTKRSQSPSPDKPEQAKPDISPFAKLKELLGGDREG